MNVTIPNNILTISNYVARCDYIFTQTFSEIKYENNRLSEITDNSTVYCWSGFLNALFSYLKTTNIQNITLISGCEDIPSNPNGIVMGFPLRPLQNIIPCPKNIKKWYAQNAEICSDFMKPIPIGTNIFPQSSKTMKKYLINVQRNKLVFVNFNSGTNPLQRNFIKNLISEQCPSVVDNPITGIEEYTKHLQQHIFSICPPGNGKDTHRMWESIYYGCIPVVEKSNMNDFFATLFPILVVDRWTDVNEESLYSKYEQIKLKSWKYDLLDVGNYFNYFDIKINNKHKGYQDIVESILGSGGPVYEKNVIYL